jgi:chromosome segregation ATPase
MHRATQKIHKATQKIHKATQKMHRATQKMHRATQKMHKATQKMHRATQKMHKATQKIHKATQKMHRATQKMHRATQKMHRATKKLGRVRAVSYHIILINAKQATDIHAYKNTKRKLYKMNAAIWFDKTCRDKELAPSYITIKINVNSRQSNNTITAVVRYRLDQEIKFLCVK